MRYAAFYMFKAQGKDKAVTDAFIHHEFHVQVHLAGKLSLAVCLVDNIFASNGAKDGDSAEFIDMVVNGLHANGTHIGDKKAGVKGA